MKNLTLLGLLLFSNLLFAQVVISPNSSVPNGAAMLDVQSYEKGILIPHLSNSVRDSLLADNDISTVPPSGVVNNALNDIETRGLLIYNTDTEAFQFWDGELWRQLFYNTTTTAGNEGVVKVNGYLENGNTVKPTLSLTKSGNAFGPEVEVNFNNSNDLAFAPSPTTSWPENILPANQISTTIFTDANRASGDFVWKENPVPGQVHLWRLIGKVTANSASDGSVQAILSNPDSGFEINSIAQIPSASAANPAFLTFYFITIADDLSIAPGKGYKLHLSSNRNVNVLIESFTRISNFKD